MKTLQITFKSLLYPKPVILKYLPDLLRLSLPGVDPSDVSKTVATLELYSAMLNWLPVQSIYKAAKKEEYPTPYIAVVDPAFQDYNPYNEDMAQVPR